MMTQRVSFDRCDAGDDIRSGRDFTSPSLPHSPIGSSAPSFGWTSAIGGIAAMRVADTFTRLSQTRHKLVPETDFNEFRGIKLAPTISPMRR